ncbi:DUF4230 domain-containing protein [Bifidobacterium oedipodis]|uniref:Lipoprotein n=1 Tax=Bifidobacterium oedipodis TaxID=2675322 RepID=A0A7Y0ERR4_9BIFI|nr:DUF4230 domain-containing protein [Bifidobacterium sp. DSM 109957]NMM95215.1 hypothetical protein [Bifidobacterium sp. DSM 109957]
MTVSKRILSIAIAAAMTLSLTSCGKEQQAPDFSNLGYVAELTTMENYYHNTAELSQDGSWFFSHGYKKAWIEYSGIIRLDINASKVTVKSKGKQGDSSVYVITIPQAQIIGQPDVDEDSFSTPLMETGFLTDITASDQTSMYDTAQQEMLKTAQADDTLFSQAACAPKTSSNNTYAPCAKQ